MQKIVSIFLLVFFHLAFNEISVAQQDSVAATMNRFEKKVVAPKKAMKDSGNVFSPRKATIRSAIIPGWGQLYNKKYWKIPLVYGALGTTAGIFVYNIKTYNLLRAAYINKIDGNDANDYLIDPRFKNLSAESIRTYRNEFRQNIDYSVLFFVLFWGLNVVDATVDAHLKEFDVNDNLSMRIRPDFSPLTKSGGLSLVFNFK